jgi:hypothetical protein
MTAGSIASRAGADIQRLRFEVAARGYSITA